MLISKEFCGDHGMIKKAVENITKMRSGRKGKGFRKLIPRDKHKGKQIKAKYLRLTGAQSFEKAPTELVKK